MKRDVTTPQKFALQGAVTMATAGALLADGRARAAGGDLCVDLSAVAEADSAALALIFDWMRVAQAAGHRLTVSGLSSDLGSLASLYGVADLIPADA